MLYVVGYVLGMGLMASAALLNCQRKAKPVERLTGNAQNKGYKPGHLPEFADPEEKTTDTFYGIKSALAFPPKNPDGTPIVAEPIKANSAAVDSKHLKSISPALVPVPNPPAK
ncbi:unnamed protein product [Bursaphelenchus xylophilus]|uniref:(pine wood nematode) hypothetical protein n=1 Tax=Bursaphelenchus xylophilus TaxID=6326 RepID=A0A1I7SAU1_BURXY|nr:unnamed protein product [Bursaphelenchus xylophilus]CAG9126771.1 unnamed protein product [Bursaphelenchus xylophilus]